MLRPSMRGSRHRVCACACACQTIHETARNAILAFIEECASDFKGKANLANVELEYQNLLRQGAERDGSPRQHATRIGTGTQQRHPLRRTWVPHTHLCRRTVPSQGTRKQNERHEQRRRRDGAPGTRRTRARAGTVDFRNGGQKGTLPNHDPTASARSGLTGARACCARRRLSHGAAGALVHGDQQRAQGMRSRVPCAFIRNVRVYC